MQEDVDTCRICSAPAEPEAPLFHPCKCSGTIRYIHQDCLTTWLAHSKKKTCDVCKYQYSFTKVYSDSMPKQLPLVLFIRKFILKVFWGVVLGLRGVMVVTIWLAILPYVTVWTWRFYFVMGENIAWWTYDKQRPSSSPIFYSYLTNLTYSERMFAKDSNATFADIITSYPVWRALSSDIFTGQIIASVIVLLFLGIFLLREWIMQNARPGVFNDGINVEEVEVQDVVGDQEPPNNPQDMANFEGAAALNGTNDGRAVEPLKGPNDSVAVEPEAQDAFPSAVECAELDDDIGSVRHAIPATDIQHKSPDKVCENQDVSNDTNVHRTSQTLTQDGSHRSEATLSTGSSEHDISITYAAGSGSTADHDDRILEDHPSSTSSTSAVQKVEDANNEPQQLFPLTLASLEAHNEVLRSSSTATDVQEHARQDKHPNTQQRPALPNLNLSAQTNHDGGQNLLLPPGPSSWKAEDQPQPSPSLTTFHAPEQLRGDSLAERGSDKAEEYFPEIDASQDSDAESSISSAAATVLDSGYKEGDIHEYFIEADQASDDEGAEEIVRVVVEEEPQEDMAEDIGVRVVHALDDDAQVADEADAFNEDDVDGALEEAIGMRGPLSTVFQNAALVIFVLDTTIGLTIWAPFTIGKTFALLSLDPPRMLQVVNSPIRIIRFVTDPLVDLCIHAFMRSVKPLLDPLTSSNASSTDMSKPSFAKSLLGGKLPLLDTMDGEPNFIGRGLSHLVNSPTANFFEPRFATLGREIRLRVTAAIATWIELAKSDDPMSRVFAIAIGYALAALLLAIYLNVFTVGNVQSAGRAIRNAIRQQLVVLKVVIFIKIELLLFPLGCGLMLDLCTLELFPGSSLSTRLAFFRYAPMTSIFYHWMIGTMFMYQFAILLGGCRKLLRPGALWFIRDPQDQNYHPIRDILERPTVLQLRKLAMSAVMYSVVVALGMSGLVISLRVWGKLCLPIRWKTREPLSVVPVDLMFMHVIMPYTIKYFRPRKFATVLARDYWKWAAKLLRISSYLFGDIQPEETRPSKNLQAFLKRALGDIGICTDDSVPVADGRYRRVPAQDKVTLPRGVSATMDVTENGEPFDEAGRRLMDLQDAESVKANRDPTKDYTTVYLPPHFRERVLAFMAMIWATGSFVTVSAFVVPTLFGRAVFNLVFDREVHDAYSFIVGSYLICGCFYAAHVLDRMDKRRQRLFEDGPRGEWAVYVFKRTMLWLGNFIWVAFWLGFVIPTLVGLAMEFYVVHPIHLIFNPRQTLEIRIFNSWTTGLIYLKMAIMTGRLRAENRLDSAIKEMQDNGWRRLDAVTITLDVIAPTLTGACGAVLLPLGLVLALKQVMPSIVPSNVLFVVVYPGILVAAMIRNAIPSLRKMLGSWAQQIRDSEFLVEMRLRNLDQSEIKTETKLLEAGIDATIADSFPEEGPLPFAEASEIEFH